MTGGEAAVAAAHWSGQAQRWQHLGPPLKPSDEDIAALAAAAAEAAHRLGRPPRVLMLGVTPEVARLAWPSGSEVTACDIAPGMVAGVWPDTAAGVAGKALVADWRALPLPSGSIDLAVGDGSYNSVDSLAAQAAVTRELHRVLAPGGRIALRVYARPDPVERPEAIFSDLAAGHIGSVSALRMRLYMATDPDGDGAVPVAKAWELWAAAGIGAEALTRATGWPAAAVDVLDAFRTSRVRFVFPTLAALRAQFAPHFALEATLTKSYEVGAHCPTLILSRR
ncbi:MAG: methyltransferase domain-containing protein [Bauldia sp.]